MSQAVLVILNTFDKDLKVKVREFLNQYKSKDVWVLSPRQIVQDGFSHYPNATYLILGEDYINPKCYPDIKSITPVTASNYTYEIEKAAKRYSISKIQ